MEFLYTLILVDRLFIEDNWTQEDEDIVGRHFKHLQKLKADGKLILAGKTSGLDLDTKGLVIFKAENLEEATAIMNSDPAIKEGIMTATLQQYDVALFNEAYKK